MIISFSYSSNKNNNINVCINPDWAPIEFRENGVTKGISIDILKNITNKLHLKTNFIYTKSWKQSQLFLKEGKCDITPTAIKTAKREKFAIFTNPYLTYDLAIITTNDKPYVTNISAIINKLITRKKGSGIITKLKTKYPNIKILTPDTYKEMFELVAHKKAYATIATLPVFAYYKKKYNLNNLKIAGFTGWRYKLRIMVNKNKPYLRDILNKQLQLLSPIETQKIYEKWIVKVKPEFNYKKFMIIISIILLIVFILSIWIYILHTKNQELKKLSKAKSDFLSNISHELKTPLNALIGFIQILKSNPKECKRYLPLLSASSQIILNEIDDIINFERLTKGIKVEKEVFHSDELKNLLLYYKENISSNIEFHIDVKLPMYLKGDINKIRNTISHLVENAIKFTKEGEIFVELKYKKGHLMFSVKDTGIGIPKNKLEEIFEEFKQLDDRINKEYQGLGLGLSISQKLVEALEGELKVESEVNKGSEFYFSIPIEKVEKQYNKLQNLNKILVVEDNKANQMFIKVILKQLDIKYDIADNGEIAVKKYKEYNYPIILMDINMPIMDGLEATKKIREYEKENNLKESKIIAVTANIIDGEEVKFFEIGMNGYIQKPIDIEKLKGVINS
jgi:two-component system sensor histidine kinase EvgS